LLDRVGAKPVILAALGLTAIGLFTLAYRPLELWIFYAGGFCVGIGLAGLLGAPLRFIALEEAGESRRGSGQGFLTLFLSVGRIVGASVIGGVVASGASELEGYRHALEALAVVAIAAAAAASGLRAGRLAARRPERG
jgi:MFS family permease